MLAHPTPGVGTYSQHPACSLQCAWRHLKRADSTGDSEPTNPAQANGSSSALVAHPCTCKTKRHQPERALGTAGSWAVIKPLTCSSTPGQKILTSIPSLPLCSTLSSQGLKPQPRKFIGPCGTRTCGILTMQRSSKLPSMRV